MKNFETQNFDAYKEQAQNNIDFQKESTKKDVESIANMNSTEITQKLADLFWVNKEKINKITSVETKELADMQEVNNVDLQLAKMFGKEKEMLNLNKASVEKQERQPLSVASVLADFEEYEEKVAA